MKLSIPNFALIVLIGPSGSGKSTFARKHFPHTAVLSSDFCRGLVSDDENNQAATTDAFEVLHYIAAKRLSAGLTTVIDATNVQPEMRKAFVALAREHDVLPVAIVLNVPEEVCHSRNKERPDRDFGPHVVRNQISQLRRGIRGLDREGFRYVHVLKTAAEVDAVTFDQQPLYNDRRHDRGPFDIIGDLHGCTAELFSLLEKLGYQKGDAHDWLPPAGRKAVFLGDLCDRGPDSVGVLKTTMAMTAAGHAMCVPGNHDVKLLRHLRGKKVQLTHGLAQTVEQLEQEPPEFHDAVAKFLDSLISHYVLDGGDLVVAHAGMLQKYIGRASGRVREFAMYGETTGEIDEFGLPVRLNWAAEYRGPAHVIYGHTPVPEADWLNRTLNIDTGCCFGGKLTALRWPERDIVSVPAARTYAEPARPFLHDVTSRTAQQEHDDVLDLADVTGKRLVQTRLQQNVTIGEHHAAAALEVMSRFAIDPRWLIYLPPTMSPTEASALPGLLEHPAEAFSYFRKQGVETVVCQEKQMGSRAVVVVCRDEAAVAKRFGVGAGYGIIFTRT
ncbi:MAG TPA: polynucleotide kinase-phosphatase, partial [Tepidisphaeraceae bacterium]